MWYSSRAGRGWARIAALLSAACVLAHLGMAVDGVDARSVPLVMASLGLAVACAPCAAGLWRGPGAGEWRMTAVMAAAMLALHTPLTRFAGHVHDGLPGTSPGSVAAAALLAVAGTVVAGHWARAGAPLGSARPGQPANALFARHQAATAVASKSSISAPMSASRSPQVSHQEPRSVQ